MAATAENRHALLYGEYGGEMRGGNSVVNVVVGARRLRALPVVSSASHAIVMHLKFWDEVAPRLRPDAVIATDASLADKIPGNRRIISIPSNELAVQAGNAMSAGLALLGGFNAATGLVATDSLVAAMKELIPSYRRQHVETNEKAIRLGAAAVKPLIERVDLGAAA
jgi:Pyruvate/2-oxoacid:ferredoxin oxidoreductase gamma subunit